MLLHSTHSILKDSVELYKFVLNFQMKKNFKQQRLLCNTLQTTPQGTRKMTTCTTLYDWGCSMTVIFIDFIHAIKPPIYKFPLTLQSAVHLFSFLRVCPQILSAIYKRHRAERVTRWSAPVYFQP